MTSQLPSTGDSQQLERRASTFQPSPENFASGFTSMSGFENRHGENGVFSHLPPYSPYDAGLGIASNSSGATNSGIVTPPTFLAQQTFDDVQSSKPQKKSCCSAKAPATVPTPTQSSCCQKNDSPMDSQTASYPSYSDRAMYTPISTPQISSWQDFYTAGQTNNSSHYTLQNQALGQPRVMPNYMPQATLDYSKPSFPQHNVSNGNGFFQGTLSQPTPSQTQTHDPPHATFNGDSKHDCDCGDNCQCLGCATHPFNSTTRQHVQEMGLLVTLDGEESSFERSNGYRNLQSNGNPDATRFNYNFANFSHFGHENHSGPMHENTDNTSPNGGSPSTEYTSEQHLMVPSEYYTIEYPVQLPSACSDVTGSCLCGNDCSCVGCLTHNGHNGFAVEPSTMENNHLSQSSPSAEHKGVGSPHVPGLEHATVQSPNPML
ncbi:putative copper-activated transcription factor GRISEA [Aspergillus thermomutatus]|uniref:Copper-fist domain-containing protein n=1 Tax=Aspergillus thermomutatus TaxID=41047 RepID=A0A397H941_ASPTH|nr:uncharacterized protein CDV56_104756 [Aspergillus thermomutatus]RHZ59581.1 hypothetical protein CDV56_104756 [Aspergillus thermomutatus]